MFSYFPQKAHCFQPFRLLIKELIEYIVTNYDDFNYKSGSDAPDKMLEDIEKLVEMEDHIRWLLTHANIKNLTAWAKEIHHDLAEKECNPDYLY